MRPSPAGPYRMGITWLMAVLLTVLIWAAPPLLLSRGVVVRALFERTHGGVAARFATASLASGVSALQAAESVRVSIDPFSVLDSRVDPAPRLRAEGFGADEISHLRDVRRVFGLAAGLTLAAALGLALAVVLGARSARSRIFSAAATIALVAVFAKALAAVALGATAFEPLFAAFHGVFFAPGTWEFPAGSALIRLFPEPFWMLAGVSWAAMAVVLAAAVRAIVFASTRTIASRA
jgi:integral membrane protein (TIGR01906 family)